MHSLYPLRDCGFKQLPLLSVCQIILCFPSCAQNQPPWLPPSLSCPPSESWMCSSKKAASSRDHGALPPLLPGGHRWPLCFLGSRWGNNCLLLLVPGSSPSLVSLLIPPNFCKYSSPLNNIGSNYAGLLRRGYFRVNILGFMLGFSKQSCHGLSKCVVLIHFTQGMWASKDFGICGPQKPFPSKSREDCKRIVILSVIFPQFPLWVCYFLFWTLNL